MKKSILGGVALAALVAFDGGLALAADIPVKSPNYNQPPAVHNWTGFYIGGHIGYGATSKEWDLVEQGGFPAGIGLGSGTINGGLGGAQVGVNYQIGNVVVGAEGDFSWAEISGQTCNIQIPGTVLCSTQVQAISTATARFGITQDRVLFYLKGGAAWVREKQEFQVQALLDPPLSGSTTENKWGWTGGAGVEYAVSRNWSAKLEYNYLTFGEDRATIALNLPPPNTVVVDIRQRMHLVKFGINYKFDWGTPVVARY